MLFLVTLEMQGLGVCTLEKSRAFVLGTLDIRGVACYFLVIVLATQAVSVCAHRHIIIITTCIQS